LAFARDDADPPIGSAQDRALVRARALRRTRARWRVALPLAGSWRDLGSSQPKKQTQRNIRRLGSAGLYVTVRLRADQKAAIGFAVRTFGAASTQGGYDA
jgi:hypothetical protein